MNPKMLFEYTDLYLQLMFVRQTTDELIAAKEKGEFTMSTYEQSTKLLAATAKAAATLRELPDNMLVGFVTSLLPR